jgi:hypothetical protein
VQIHESENKKQKYKIGSCQPYGIICSQILFQTVRNRMNHTTEIHGFSQQVGGNGVHTIYFQPFQTTVVSPIVHPIVKKSH